jgi:hypothetical protein
MKSTVIAQCAKAPDIHSYIAGSIPAVTPRDCAVKTINFLRNAIQFKPFELSLMAYILEFAGQNL